MLWYLLICLAISLLTIGYYDYTGFHSKSHRLLPLALGMVCLYNFYMTIDYIAGYPEVILSISYGMAECPTEHAEYDKLFELADERMYQKKKEMKMERGRTS